MFAPVKLARLRDSLSNPDRPLLALVSALQEVGELQVSKTVDELVAQTGAEDPASVRLAVKENRKLSPSEVEVLVDAYRVGESEAELARRFGLHEQTVRAHLRRQGVTLRLVRVLTESQDDEVVRLYIEEVWSLAEVAVKFGISPAAVRQVLVRRGIERRPQTKRRRH